MIPRHVWLVGLLILTVYTGTAGIAGGISETQRIAQGAGTDHITILALTNFATSTVTFPTPFPYTPDVDMRIFFDPFGGGFTQTIDTMTILTSGNVAETWTSMPVALTEIFGNTRNRGYIAETADSLTGIDALYFTANVVTAGVSGSKLRVQVSNDLSTWVDPCDSAGLMDLSISSTGFKNANCAVAIGNFASNGWLYLRIVGVGGNGVASPSFGLIQVALQQEVGIISSIQLTDRNPFNFTYAVTTNTYAQGDGTYNIGWTAIVCLNGASSC